MRKAFAETLAELARQDPRIILLTADLGYMALDPFSRTVPDQFINVGVAEQNLVGVGTGLAEAGFIPFLYSIAPFAALRPYEFIRNGPILHRLPVRIVGVGGGFEYGPNGMSHYGLEDIALMRVQPDMMIVCPADFHQARTAIQKTWDLPGPIYYRLGKDDLSVVPGLEGEFEVGRIQILSEGADLAFLSMGSITNEVVAAAEKLRRGGVCATVAVVSSMNPDPTEDLVRLLARFPAAVSVEAHYLNGALGSLVAEVISENKLACRLKRCGIRATPEGLTGSQTFMEQQHGLSCNALAEAARSLLE